MNQFPGKGCLVQPRRSGRTVANRPAVRGQTFCWSVTAALCLALLLSTRLALADSRPASIIVAFDARSDEQKQAVAAIQAHVSDLPLQVVVIPLERAQSLAGRLSASGGLAAARHALGTFYIELAEDGSLLVFFTEATGESSLIRRLHPNQQGLRVALEQAAIVVRSLAEALLDGGSVGIGTTQGPQPQSRPNDAGSNSTTTPRVGEAASTEPRSEGAGEQEPESDEALQVSAQKSASNHRFAVVAGSPLSQFAAGAPWQTGFSPGIQWLAAPAWYVGARYTLLPALSLSSADVTVSVERHPLEALVGYREAGRLALNAELGVLADRVGRTTVRVAAPYQATPSDARWQLAVGARGGFSWSPWSDRLWLALRIGADLLLTRYSYASDSNQNVPSARPIRPRVELELAVWVW